jgi:undecaprenyl diphosphate synthase
MGLLEKIDKSRLPKHIAIIMDGNGRWAKKKGMLRMFGHQSGVKSVRDVCEACAKLDIPYLTVYAFSSENWNRPQQEVNALMTLLVKTIKGETPSLIKNNIRLQAIGNIALLPSKCIRELNEAIEATKNNTGTTLILALSYSSKWDIVNAFKNIATRIKSGELEEEDINEEIISNNLTTHLYPNPELLIRTSGEYRLSNFLLWELAYSEFHFTEVLWPDFSQEHLYQAIIDYQSRERRFGKTSEQIVS